MTSPSSHPLPYFPLPPGDPRADMVHRPAASCNVPGSLLQVEHRGMELLGQLMGPWGLNQELRILRGFFLMGTPALEAS